MINEIVHLLAGDEHVFEKGGLSADDSSYAATGISSRRKKANRRAAPALEPRPASRQELIVLVGFFERVADDDAVYNVSHFVAFYARSRTTTDSLP
jgi:hypothetical protein